MISLKRMVAYYINGTNRKNLKVRSTTARNTHLYETTVYESGNKKLVFVGCSHRYGGSKFFVDFLRGIFSHVKPEIVLLEYSYKKSTPYFEHRMNSRPKKDWGEVEWATYLSKEFKSILKGMDEDKKILDSIIINKNKDGFKILLFIRFLFYYRYLANAVFKNKLPPDDVYFITKAGIFESLIRWNTDYTEQLIHRMRMLQKRYGLSLNKVIDRVMDEVTKKYIIKKPASFVLDKDKYFYLNSSNRSAIKKYKINYFLILFEAARDRRMVASCIEALKKHNRVVAIAGSAHISGLRTILEDEIRRNIGEVRMTMWKEAS